MFQNLVPESEDTGNGSVPIILQQEMEVLGFQANHCLHNVCEGYVALSDLMQIVAVPQVLFVTPVGKPMTNTGSVTSEGDVAMNKDFARTTYSISGAGKLVGVLSDSFDCKTSASTNYAADIQSGDLPPGITVISDLTNGCIDEGRAMMQLIYDVAPNAQFAFHTAFLGFLDFADGIRKLADIGCDIIVDDSEFDGLAF